MKKVLLLIAAAGAFSANAQKPVTVEKSAMQDLPDSLRTTYKKDPLLSRWIIDINATGGALMQDLKLADTHPNYLNAIDPHTGKLKFSKGMSMGADIELGYFFGEKGHWGIGTGFMYFQQKGDITLDEFRVQYQSYDGRSGTFRQLITATAPIVESQRMTSLNIPLLAKYKYRFTKRVGVTADAGVFYNMQYKSDYTTRAKFDYEAIYKFNGEGTPIYDPNYYPAYNDWLITNSHMSIYKPQGVADSMNFLRSQGYNVGLNQDVNKRTGIVSYTSGSFGFLVRPALSYYLSDKVAVNLGLYYTYQKVNNTTESTYRLTDKVGDYTSVTKTVSTLTSQSYGGSIGLRMFIGLPTNLYAVCVMVASFCMV